MRNFLFLVLFSNCLYAQNNTQIVDTLDYNSGEVSVLNFDPFFSSVKLCMPFSFPHSAVKPVMTPIGLHNIMSKEAIGNTNNKTINIFPVANFIGAIARQNTFGEIESLRSGVGFGLISGWKNKLYFRSIIVGNYFYRSNISNNLNGVLPNSYFQFENNIELQPNIRISYSPNKFFNFQTGIDHNFIGEGQRSMLLSDYSAPYPFFQMRSSIWKFQFVNIYQFLRERQNSSWEPKFTATHFLNFQPFKNFQIGLFETVVFRPSDTLLKRGYEWEYLNPFLFYRPTEYGIGSQDRILLGLNTSYNVGKLMFYGQLIIDDFVLNELLGRTRWWSNKYAGQFGIKGKFHLTRKSVLNFSSELNFARPFTYSHLNQGTNWGHQGIPLAHPLGANFVESYSFFQLKTGKLKVKTELIINQQGGQNSTDEFMYGQDIYRSYVERPYEYGYYIGGNGKLNRTRVTMELSYAVVEKMKMELFVRPIYTWNSGTEISQSLFVFGGLRTNLWNERSLSF